jgi:hypothetical protein
MKPGEGYWVRVPADSLWTVSTTPVITGPYAIYGYVQLYDGTYAGGYDPLVSTGGATVTATWWDPRIGWNSTAGTTNPLGQYALDISGYLDGGLVYVNATFDAPYGNNGYNYTFIDVMGGGSFQNVVCGVPYSVEMTQPPELSIVLVTEPFLTTYRIVDIDGCLAMGYYTFSDGPMLWESWDPLFTPPAPKYFNGIGVDDGQATVFLTLMTESMIWINVTEGGSAASDNYLTPWDGFFIDPANTCPGWLRDWAHRVLLVI